MNPLILLSTAALLTIALLGCGTEPVPATAAAEPAVYQLFMVMCAAGENECEEVASGAPLSPEECSDRALELAQGPTIIDDQGRELTGLVCRP